MTMLKRYDLQTVNDTDGAIEHHYIITGSKHTKEYQELKNKLINKGYIRTLDVTPLKSEIEKELNAKGVNEDIKNYILNQKF